MDFVKVVTAKKIKKQNNILFKQEVQEKIIFPKLLNREEQLFVVVFLIFIEITGTKNTTCPRP